MAEHDDIEARALDWVVRTGSDAFDDWPAFHAWLEADPRHAVAYHAMSMDIEGDGGDGAARAGRTDRDAASAEALAGLGRWSDRRVARAVRRV
ncbi:FecR/PupR family sigma factor regulator [Sphingomonas sp. H160509]|uniref:FecR/PupR family sigma factor regulator n=1 Tax=Sphingomonas sp. H160509 TaxID=2955313 RepID=UPI00209742EB|nr:FecR/PupR family sigma factor regulator [Sphingomonas sp. H160509]MDD1452194.1 FecR/PupR family sigma factor regulator [Sphingomonas sp. H160509]